MDPLQRCGGGIDGTLTRVRASSAMHYGEKLLEQVVKTGQQDAIRFGIIGDEHERQLLCVRC